MRFHKPDLMAFTGDKRLRTRREYGIVREPTDMAILDYLRKWSHISAGNNGETAAGTSRPSRTAWTITTSTKATNLGRSRAQGRRVWQARGQDQGGYVMDPPFRA